MKFTDPDGLTSLKLKYQDTHSETKMDILVIAQFATSVFDVDQVSLQFYTGQVPADCNHRAVGALPDLLTAKIPVKLAHPDSDKVAAANLNGAVKVVEMMVPGDEGERLVEHYSGTEEFSYHDITVKPAMFERVRRKSPPDRGME